MRGVGQRALVAGGGRRVHARRLQVHGEQAARHEAAAAQRARVGPRAAVVPLVDHQRGALRERLAAVRAHVRLLARVHALVQLQVALLGEGLAAHLAGVRLVAGVHAQVELEVLARREHLAADGAQVVVARAGVRARVAPQRVGVREGARAEGAAQRGRRGGGGGVRQRAVRQQRAQEHEGERARVAQEARGHGGRGGAQLGRVVRQPVLQQRVVVPVRGLAQPAAEGPRVARVVTLPVLVPLARGQLLRSKSTFSKTKYNITSTFRSSRYIQMSVVSVLQEATTSNKGKFAGKSR